MQARFVQSSTCDERGPPSESLDFGTRSLGRTWPVFGTMPQSTKFIDIVRTSTCMSKGGEVARRLKDRLPQHVDDLECIARSFDRSEQLLKEADERWDDLNAGTA